jgi:archaemetzincin
VEKGNAIKGAIALVPVSPVWPDLLTWLDGQLAKVLGRHVIVGEGIPLPENAYNPRRRQYLGEAILDALRALPYPTAGRVLGLTEADCTTPGLNFIFGQAALNGREAFVALPRLRSSFYGLAEDPDLPDWRRRALKECVHELGHTWGLRHCRDLRCVMRFSNSLLDTDAKGAAFCSRCQRRLEAAGRPSRP